MADGAKLYSHEAQDDRENARGVNRVMCLSHMDVIADSVREEEQSCWYAAYTFANHERRVAEKLDRRGVEHFLPMYDAIRQWKDRRVRLRLPLFPGYVFVRIPLSEKLRVLQLAGVARFVGFGDFPVSLADDEIEGLRRGISRYSKAEPHPYLSTGQRMRILRDHSLDWKAC